MCGICGSFSLDGAPVDVSLLEGMTEQLRHRGPDGGGLFVDGPIGLGHRRLAIVDPAGGQQPITNADETVWVTYNGEIYNFPDLLAELVARGHQFRTRCDTEVVIHAYEEWGLDFLPRLNGMFAFGLWDAKARRLVLARDPFGIKPLYLWRTSHQVAFASEMKAFLVDPGFPRDLDLASLDEYLTYGFVPSPRTMLAAVTKLRPGECVVVENGRIESRMFSRAAPVIRSTIVEAEALEEVRDRLVKAVSRQMMSDVPVGAMLSGGVDSATVVALMRKATQQPVKTFTIGFAGDFRRNELEAARVSARILGTDHYDLVMTAQDCLDAFDTMIWHLDEPIATPSAVALLAVSRLAAEHVKVVLTGQGADEPWAGYRRYRGERIGGWYRRIPPALRNNVVIPFIGSIPRAEAAKRAALALGADDPLGRFMGVYTVFSPPMKRQLYRERAIDHDPTVPLEYWRAPVRHLEPLAQQLYVETRLSLADNLLLYGDKMAMAVSLEARVPLLDLDLMDLVEALPTRLRLRGWAGHKYLLRKAVSAWLPPEILARPKIGFATPVDQWFQQEITGHLRERLASSGSGCTKYFSTAYIRRLIDEHIQRREDHSRPLFSLLVFERWYEAFIRGVTAAAPSPTLRHSGSRTPKRLSMIA